jgi:hypothetical protein
MGRLSEQYNAQVAAQAEKQGARLLTRLNLGIAAAVAVVAIVLVITVPKLIPKSPEELYDADRTRVREAVLLSITGYSAKPVTHMSSDLVSDEEKNKYPSYARVRLGTNSALKEADAGVEEITTLLMGSHPGGSKDQGGTPIWEDVDGDGLRGPVDEMLFYHKASPEPSVDHWNTTPITVKGVDYVVDSRDWFIDFVVTAGSSAHLSLLSPWALSCPQSGSDSTYPSVQISGATSVSPGRGHLAELQSQQSLKLVLG